jgi:transcription factor WhiB
VTKKAAFRDTTLYGIKPPEFSNLGACVGRYDIEWIPEDHRDSDTPEAIAICERCPVQMECLEDALTQGGESRNGDGLGIRGGTTEQDRMRLRQGLPLAKDDEGW